MSEQTKQDAKVQWLMQSFNSMSAEKQQIAKSLIDKTLEECKWAKSRPILYDRLVIMRFRRYLKESDIEVA